MSKPNEVTISQDEKGKFVCSPDPVVAQGRDAKLTFRLDVKDHSFRSHNAVVVHNGNGQFPDPSHTENSKVVKLRDLNSQDGTFKYSVFLKRDATGDEVEIDPEIKNQT